jgi:hypothetical protein
MNPLRAFSKAMTPFVAAHPYFSVLAPIWLILAAGVLYQSVGEQIHERDSAMSENQARYEIERQANQIRAEAASIVAEATKAQCHVKSVCKTFSAAREQCAAAADFQRCVQGRMGADFPETLNCTNDGHVAGTEAQPSTLQCLFH